ncbi:hypothetical protein D9M68_957570 [compost metagenome]
MSEAFDKLVFVGFPVGDGVLGHAGFHGCFGHGRRNGGDQARVYRFRDDIVFTEGKVNFTVSQVHQVRNGLFSQFGE